MRLGSLLLIPATLVAQVPEGKSLPWERLQEPPWQLGAVGPLPAPLATKRLEADKLPLRVELRGDGSLRILDARGLVTLRSGLPGRPVRAWRDAGTVMDLSEGVFRFPRRSGLDGGIASMPLAPGEDFRALLSGLLWVLDDGERVLSILNPSRGQLVFVPLPAGNNLDLHFHPDRLEVWTGGDSLLGRRERVVWTLPWVALMPQFLSLAAPRPAGPPGTALKPYPSQQPGTTKGALP